MAWPKVQGLLSFLGGLHPRSWPSSKAKIASRAATFRASHASMSTADPGGLASVSEHFATVLEPMLAQSAS